MKLFDILEVGQVYGFDLTIPGKFKGMIYGKVVDKRTTVDDIVVLEKGLLGRNQSKEDMRIHMRFVTRLVGPIDSDECKRLGIA